MVDFARPLTRPLTVNPNTGSESETYANELIAADYLAGIGVEQRLRVRE